MTETERKALALVSEVILEVSSNTLTRLDPYNPAHEAVRRAIERHEAFRQEVSDAVRAYKADNPYTYNTFLLDRFIITKPDPLVEVLADMGLKPKGGYDWASEFRNTLDARGLEIVEKKS